MWPTLIVAVLLLMLAIRDLTQKKHAILRNFPVLGHCRYLLEKLGPELRQYIVASNNEERPFNRDQRSWVYASAKQQNNYFGFGTDNDLELSPNHLIVKHSAFPILAPVKGQPGYDECYRLPCAKVWGEARGRKHAFRPESVISVSAMSYGSLSAAAVEALNIGCRETSSLHNTGEGGISDHHAKGAGLIWQIGTGYYGCRDSQGNFDLSMLKENVDKYEVRALEVKLSQGAKPGMGGVLPAAKITPEIAMIRGIPEGKDCLSPARHSAFGCTDEMLDFIERLADETGLPVGIKSAIGQQTFWTELADLMEDGKRGVDYIAVDGGEGGTGAAPLTFSDHVSLPFKQAFPRVYSEFFARDLHNRIVFIGSGKLGFPAEAALSFALGCDMIAVAREAMMAVGCIQAQICQTGKCPTGVATQNKWLMRGLDPTDKSARAANYIRTLRKELLQLSHVCGVVHPALIRPDDFEILNERFGSRTATEVFVRDPNSAWGLPSEAQQQELIQLMEPQLSNG